MHKSTIIIILFIVLLIIGCALNAPVPLIEGNSNYQNYDDLEQTDPLYLATKNASNIAWLKEQLDDITTFRKQIQDMQIDISNNATNINEIQQAIAQQGESLTGTSGDPNDPVPQATGLD